MWKKDDGKPQGISSPSQSAVSPASVPSASTLQNTTPLPGPTPSIFQNASSPTPIPPLPVASRGAACISQGIKIKGEVTGSEDLFVDGTVDGKLNLVNGSLTIGPNGHVKADVTAREVIVRGNVEGKVSGRDRVQLWSTGQISGEVQTERLSVEEGALLRGNVEAGKQSVRAPETKAGLTPAFGKPTEPASLGSGTAAIRT
jgi:cytoskeletal protein CcmA (bactofilin family)